MMSYELEKGEMEWASDFSYNAAAAEVYDIIREDVPDEARGITDQCFGAFFWGFAWGSDRLIEDLGKMDNDEEFAVTLSPHRVNELRKLWKHLPKKELSRGFKKNRRRLSKAQVLDPFFSSFEDYLDFCATWEGLVNEAAAQKRGIVIGVA